MRAKHPPFGSLPCGRSRQGVTGAVLAVKAFRCGAPCPRVLSVRRLRPCAVVAPARPSRSLPFGRSPPPPRALRAGFPPASARRFGLFGAPSPAAPRARTLCACSARVRSAPHACTPSAPLSAVVVLAALSRFVRLCAAAVGRPRGSPLPRRLCSSASGGFRGRSARSLGALWRPPRLCARSRVFSARSSAP